MKHFRILLKINVSISLSVLLSGQVIFAVETSSPAQQISQVESVRKSHGTSRRHDQESLTRKQPKLTLQQAIDTALENLPQIRAAQAGIHAAEAGVKETRSSYYPDIHLFAEDMEGTNNQTRSSYLALPGIPRTGLTGDSSDLSNNFLGGLVLNQTLYDFGRRSSQLKTSKSEALAATYGLEVSRQDAIFNVKQAYFTLLATRRLINASQASVTMLKQVLEMAKKGYEVGLRPKIDVSTAKTNLLDVQTTLIRFFGQLKNAKATLNHAMGLESPFAYEVEDILGHEKVKGALKDFQEMAYRKRPELKEMLAKEEGAKSAVDTAKGNNYPLLVGSTGVNGRGSDEFSPVSNWDAAVILDVPLNWHKVRHQVAKAKAQLTKTSELTQATRLQIALEVEETYNDMLSTKERIPSAKQNLEQARERLEIAEGRYASGVGNIIEVTDAQTFLTNAETGYIRALYDYNRAVAQLERADGRPLAR